jgi:porphobilinogen synthase
MSNFPESRLRRYRRTAPLRKLFDTEMPGPARFMWPTFVIEGSKRIEPITSMPGQNRYSVDMLLKALDSVVAQGIGSVLLFGVAGSLGKDNEGSAAFSDEGVVQQAVRAIKKQFPQLVVVTDVCLCAYTDHGHCGLLNSQGDVDNDTSINALRKIAVSHANAGADIVAPSAMMDGQVRTIRRFLDTEGHNETLIMSYSTKFASSLYGPFRDAEGSVPGKGDRQGYQASYRDARQSLRESTLDEAEGADILMVKPALLYLDLLKTIRGRTELPIAAYNVSGEYSMLVATAEKGWGDLRAMVRESTFAMARAGSDILISYWANRYNELLRD